MTEQDPCTVFRAAFDASMADTAAAPFPTEQVTHLNGCEDCQGWLDDNEDKMFRPGDSPEDAMRRMAPFMAAVGTLEVSDEETETTRALRAQRAADERRVDEAVRAFIGRHPHLAPAAHGIDMAKYEYAAFFCALNGVNMLIRRIARRGEEEPSSYGLREDGAVLVGGVVKVPAASVLREIRESIVGERKVPDDEKTPDLGEALRREAAWSDDETCAKLAKWIVEAMRVKPDIMRNYRVIGAEGGDILLLEPIRTGTGERDAVELWNVRARR